MIFKFIKKAKNSIQRNGFAKFFKNQLLKPINKFRFFFYKNKNIDEISFGLYSNLIDKIYGEGSEIITGQISSALLKKIETEFCNEESFINSDKIIYSNDFHSMLMIDNYSNEIRKNLSENIIAGNIHLYNSKHPTLKLLHDELRRMFEVHIGSPFVFVNTRIWKTKPKSQKFGPNDWHTDGFLPGHRKIMVYVTPLNGEYGTFEWQDSQQNYQCLNDKSPGQAVFFRNSDISHTGVCGKKFERISIEVTLMRALIKGNQEWQGHFFGRHLKNLKLLDNRIS